MATGGAETLLARARALHGAGDLTLACHLVDWVLRAELGKADAWQLWRDLFAARAQDELNMMARNTFRRAVREAEERLAAVGNA